MSAHDVAASARPAYRDVNVLRWLSAYTASVTGDVVYFLALSWAATRAGGPSQVGTVVAAGALPGPCSCSAGAWWPTGSGHAASLSPATRFAVR